MIIILVIMASHKEKVLKHAINLLMLVVSQHSSTQHTTAWCTCIQQEGGTPQLQLNLRFGCPRTFHISSASHLLMQWNPIPPVEEALFQALLNLTLCWSANTGILATSSYGICLVHLGLPDTRIMGRANNSSPWYWSLSSNFSCALQFCYGSSASTAVLFLVCSSATAQ